MRPPKREINYEKVAIGEMLKGVIKEVVYEENHTFKGFNGGADTIQPAIKLKFELVGYQYLHSSRWMKFSLGSKANLYVKYVSKLVEGATPDMDLDLDCLKGMKVKTVWSEKGDFQNLDTIYPDGPKVKADALPEKPPAEEDLPPETHEEEAF